MKTGPKAKTKPEGEDPLAGDISEILGTAKLSRLNLIYAPKDTTVTLRIPRAVLDAAKKVAKKRGIKYHRMMRDAIVNLVVKAA